MPAWARRPLAAHTFSIELDLVCADDLDHDTLVHSLTQLATAGLHGMVASITSVVLDGGIEEVFEGVMDASCVRPPPDARLQTVLSELERATALLRSISKGTIRLSVAS